MDVKKMKNLLMELPENAEILVRDNEGNVSRLEDFAYHSSEQTNPSLVLHMMTLNPQDDKDRKDLFHQIEEMTISFSGPFKEKSQISSMKTQNEIEEEILICQETIEELSKRLSKGGFKKNEF